MFKKVLVANRGEIALRIIRALREMSVKSVAVCSEADKNNFYCSLADDCICIGPAAAASSYLNVSQIISAALVKKCDAVHPGYGFLAENPHFAEICASYGLSFIGPSAETIALAGQKAEIIDLVKRKKIPVVPGSKGIVANAAEAKKIAAAIKYPVIIKATAGGGGKGMRIVRGEKDIEQAFELAGAEAKNAFSNAGLYVEKYIESPRHIEIQIAADKKGRVLYFPERDCSIQRNHQKVLEEGPSPQINAKLRKKLGETACRVAKLINYTTVGTVEFLVSKNDFYFMEMNARIQVEHPVTELVSDIDLVKMQIALAAGQDLPLGQDDVKEICHAVECRINSEDENYMPSAGKIEKLILPGGPGVRVDTAMTNGSEISPFYDSMIAKIITYGRDRAEAIERMKRALMELKIEGVTTNIALHQKILQDENFIKGCYTTDFIGNMK
ncbi:MAG: acetyl-CoA carboxylase biotin carboxylase subunit [Candidatus Omnitrophota bacterium]|nr:acetyl-CoA carboxylase biotin carboxylase subunit [Candidatus Omnitrophota bacterium]MBU2529130.1 acetyl-CoA carboxylase biotin carboxylase subunit [bacterium]MBU3929477.1 acetyl-CoA carboxylase biotin carboxylase subunit [bacterium]MBU4122826.1 acetyl-CoA carboxylase biotin carboxylase subunit [bacterium]